MVVTIIWMESITVVIISICTLSVVGLILILCVCWGNRKKQKRHFYIIDQGLKKVPSIEMKNMAAETSYTQKTKNVLDYLPLSGNFKNIFLTAQKSKCSSECDLIQPMKGGDVFDPMLRLGTNDKNNLMKSTNIQEKEDDLRSCVSDESKHTFYSMYHTVSASSTVRSVLSDLDDDDAD